MDFLTKIGTSISFTPPIYLTQDLPAAPLLLLPAPQAFNTKVSFPVLTFQVDIHIWDTQNTSVVKHHSPIVIQLQDPTKYITQAQYPPSLQSLKRLKPIFSELVRKNLLRPTSSPFNTTILAVKKSNGNYRLVQDLWLY